MALLLAFAACLTPEMFPEQYARAICDKHEECGVTFDPELEPGEKCEDRLDVASIESHYGAAEWDADLAADCLDEIDEAACDDGSWDACVALGNG
jgi:predicted esterase YcpF (UPF0227 family)